MHKSLITKIVLKYNTLIREILSNGDDDEREFIEQIIVENMHLPNMITLLYETTTTSSVITVATLNTIVNSPYIKMDATTCKHITQIVIRGLLNAPSYKNLNPKIFISLFNTLKTKFKFPFEYVAIPVVENLPNLPELQPIINNIVREFQNYATKEFNEFIQTHLESLDIKNNTHDKNKNLMNLFTWTVIPGPKDDIIATKIKFPEPIAAWVRDMFVHDYKALVNSSTFDTTSWKLVLSLAIPDENTFFQCWDSVIVSGKLRLAKLYKLLTAAGLERILKSKPPKLIIQELMDHPAMPDTYKVFYGLNHP